MIKTKRLQTKLAPILHGTTSRQVSTRKYLLAMIAVILLVGYAGAQLPVPASSEFDITGFIEVATLGGPGTGGGAGAHQGGFITVNGHVITVPSETIVILPANALTWQELFAQAPAPYGPTQTGLALADVPAPLTTYEAHVVGNRVLGGPGGADVYIAGLIWISQQALNSGQGFINCINYITGEIRVGGPIGNCAAGARVRLNDPLNPAVGTGRYGRPMSPDVRFTVDQDNPTISSMTGFPMCIPRVLADPSIPGNPDDPLCPLTQRPLTVAGVFSTFFTMNDPTQLPGVPPDPNVQAPFEVGDYVTFAGTLVADPLVTPGPTAGPWPGIASTYISAHTMINNAAIYTAPSTNPAYVTVNVSLIGTGGLVIIGANEATIRTRFEGFTTDVAPTAATQRNIHLYGIDLNPATGATSDRDWGTIGVDPGPPAGAAKGRWRFRPPCLPFGSVPTKPDKECVMNAAGTFLPPTREVRAVIQGAFTAPITPASPTAANGIVWGQYHAPIADYLFPEQLPGQPIPENNFNSIPFLASGGYTSSAGTLVGQLDPWPSNVIPPPVCTAAAVANAGGPYAVGSGGTIPLAGSATGTTPISYSWIATAGSFNNPTVPTPNYTAPQVAVATPVTLTLTATNCAGPSTSTATVNVAAALAPTVNPIANQSVVSGNAGTFSVSGADPNVPTSVPLSWTVSQTGTISLLNLTITSTGSTTADVNYSAPAGVLVNTGVTVTVTATNAAGVASAPVSTTVTVTPQVVCTPPVANAGGPYTVGSGSSISLAGSATGTTPITFAWTPPALGTINPLSSPTATYAAPVVLVQTPVSLSLTASNSCGSNTASTTVTVNAALPPVVNAVAPVSVFSGAAGSFSVSGSDPNVPALLPLLFAATQTGNPPLGNLTVTQGPNPPGTGATVSFTAPTLPLGQVTSSVVTVNITATNTAPLTSAPVSALVTVNPLPDVVSITSVEYRTGKQRLIITATSSVNSANVVLKLQPYACQVPGGLVPCPGGIYNPDPAAGGLGNTFTLAAGIYTLDVTGVPEPACNIGGAFATPCLVQPPPIIVKSNLNGQGTSEVTRIRQ
jgi:hypothetical protein